MLADELNLKWHKEWRKQVVDAFCECRDVDMGEYVEIPLADWERLQKTLLQSPSRTLPFIETVDELLRGKCICSDGPFHYTDCPQYANGCNDSFGRLRKDAARYRWLRIKCGLVPSAFGIGQVAMTLAGSTDEHDAKRIDAHIDAAMNGANAELNGTP